VVDYASALKKEGVRVEGGCICKNCSRCEEKSRDLRYRHCGLYGNNLAPSVARRFTGFHRACGERVVVPLIAKTQWRHTMIGHNDRA
jgi:hypothetical protein